MRERPVPTPPREAHGPAPAHWWSDLHQILFQSARTGEYGLEALIDRMERRP